MGNLHITKRVPSPWRASDFLTLALLTLLFGIVLYSYQLRLPGAFVFGDQTEYAGMTHSLLHGQNMHGYRQYGPLYPMMTAAFQAVLPNLSMFRAGLIINLLVSLAALLPFYRLCRVLLMPGWMTTLCALTLVLAPFWTFATVTWADPLFYALFFFSLFSVFDIKPEDGAHRYLFLGMLAGLMFLAKPVGLFYVVAMVMALAIGRKGWPDRRTIGQMLIVALGSAICILPWIYRNIAIEQTSALGYSYVGTMFKDMLAQSGWVKMIGLFVAAIGFHLAYILISTLGAASILPAATLRYWRLLTERERVLICYVVLSLAAVAAVSAVHMFVNPYLGYWVPNGRYLTQYVPPMILLAAMLWLRTNQLGGGIPATWGWLSCLLTAVVIYICSPLESMATFSIFNNPEMAPYFLLLDGRDIVWRAHFDPSQLQRLIPIVATMLLSLPFFCLRQRRGAMVTCILLTLVLLGVSSWHQSRLIRMMAWSQKPVNALFRQDDNEQKGIDLCMPQGVYFEPSLQERNVEFIRGFWCPGSPTRFATPQQACQQHAALADAAGRPDNSVLFVSSNKSTILNAQALPFGSQEFSVSRLACTGN